MCKLAYILKVNSLKKWCSVFFSRYKKESDNFILKIYENEIKSKKEMKFLGLNLLNFNILVEEIKERCNKRLNQIKILSNKKCALNQNTFGY